MCCKTDQIIIIILLDVFKNIIIFFIIIKNIINCSKFCAFITALWTVWHFTRLRFSVFSFSLFYKDITEYVSTDGSAFLGARPGGIRHAAVYDATVLRIYAGLDRFFSNLNVYVSHRSILHAHKTFYWCHSCFFMG
jgi:hypothetical protein